MGFIKYFREEAAIIKERDPAIKSKWEVLLYPSFWAVWKYRKAHKHYQKGHFFRARYISQRSARKTGIEIHPGAQIGSGFFIDHGHGVIIGETTIIGDNVTLNAKADEGAAFRGWYIGNELVSKDSEYILEITEKGDFKNTDLWSNLSVSVTNGKDIHDQSSEGVDNVFCFISFGRKINTPYSRKRVRRVFYLEGE